MKVFLTYPINRPLTFNIPDLGLGYLASALRKNQIDYQMKFDSMSESELISILKSYAPDVIGIKILVTGIRKAQKTIRIIRDTLPHSIVIIGGPHITADSDDVLNYIPADYAIHGDAEHSLPAFIKCLEEHDDYSNVRGLIYRKNGGIIVNPPDIITNLDELDFPAWDVMKPEKYKSYNISRRSPVAYMISSRGCDGVCEFCFGKSRDLRHRSLQNIIDELDLLYYEHGIREIHFRDDNFASKKGNVVGLSQYILDNKMELSWASPDGMRLVSVDDEMLSIMSSAGFYRTAVGIETSHLDSLKKIRKGTSPDIISTQLKLFNKHNIEVYGTFIIGLPWETYSDMRETLSFAMNLPLDAFVPNMFTPYPGTKEFFELKKTGELSDKDYYKLDHYSYSNPFLKYRPYTIKLITRYFLLRYYLRPSFLFRTLRKVNFQYAKTIARMFKLLYLDSMVEEKF